MEIQKISFDWARAELLSNGVFALFGVIFVLASLGFSVRGETDMARAFVIPTLLAGVLLLILGGGLAYGTWKSLSGFEPSVTQDAAGFIASEIERADRTLAQYRTAVFKVMPLMIAFAALLIIVLHGPAWRAALITAIVFLSLIMFIDSNATARLEVYKDRLLRANATSQISLRLPDTRV